MGAGQRANTKAPLLATCAEAEAILVSIWHQHIRPKLCLDAWPE